MEHAHSSPVEASLTAQCGRRPPSRAPALGHMHRPRSVRPGCRTNMGAWDHDSRFQLRCWPGGRHLGQDHEHSTPHPELRVPDSGARTRDLHLHLGVRARRIRQNSDRRGWSREASVTRTSFDTSLDGPCVALLAAVIAAPAGTSSSPRGERDPPLGAWALRCDEAKLCSHEGHPPGPPLGRFRRGDDGIP